MQGEEKKKKSQLWDWCNDLQMGPVSMKKIYCVPGERVRMGQLRFLLPAVVYPTKAGVIEGWVNPLGAEIVGTCRLSSSWSSYTWAQPLVFLLNPPCKIFSPPKTTTAFPCRRFFHRWNFHQGNFFLPIILHNGIIYGLFRKYNVGWYSVSKSFPSWRSLASLGSKIGRIW